MPKEIFINTKILRALGFTAKEKAVFDILVSSKHTSGSGIGEDVASIAKMAGIKRNAANKILLGFEARGLAMTKRQEYGTRFTRRFRWKFKPGIDGFGRGCDCWMKKYSKEECAKIEEIFEE